jgi:TolB-like protein/Tfp pilus assembly protein PilF
LRSLACRDRFEEALEIADQLLTSEPALVAARVWQTYCFDALGEPEKARASTAELRRHAPHIRTDHVDGIVCLADRELTARIVDAHRRSGLLDAEPAVLDRPSIAVMPFDGLSTAPDQEFLADGMAEDIIAGLSKFRWLLVIARRSTFTYKGQTRDIREIASELGVRYIVEGTVRKSGNRIRVTAQLVDAETGNHIWSDRYDRKMDDIFVIQDEVAEAIIRAVAPEISQAEIERARRLPPENLDAWAHYQRGLAIEASGEEADFSASIEHFDRAVKADPTFADALAMASLQRTRLAHFFRSEHSDRLFSEADQLSRKAMRLDPRNPVALFARGRLLNVRGEFSQALEYCERAVELDPNSVLAHLQLAAILGDADRRWLESLETYERILELSPKDPHRANVFTGRAYNLFYLRRYDECVTSARAALASENPRYWATLSLVAGLAALGRKAELADAMADLLKRKPDITLRHVAMFHTFKTPGYIDALRKAGVPE